MSHDVAKRLEPLSGCLVYDPHLRGRPLGGGGGGYLLKHSPHRVHYIGALGESQYAPPPYSAAELCEKAQSVRLGPLSTQ